MSEEKTIEKQEGETVDRIYYLEAKLKSVKFTEEDFDKVYSELQAEKEKLKELDFEQRCWFSMIFVTCLLFFLLGGWLFFK
jgi:hypothetical protein